MPWGTRSGLQKDTPESENPGSHWNKEIFHGMPFYSFNFEPKRKTENISKNLKMKFMEKGRKELN